jgi:hypothetical protein
LLCWLMEMGDGGRESSVTITAKKFKLHFYSCFIAKVKLELLILLAPVYASRRYRELVYLSKMISMVLPGTNVTLSPSSSPSPEVTVT